MCRSATRDAVRLLGCQTSWTHPTNQAKSNVSTTYRRSSGAASNPIITSVSSVQSRLLQLNVVALLADVAASRLLTDPEAEDTSSRAEGTTNDATGSDATVNNSERSRNPMANSCSSVQCCSHSVSRRGSAELNAAELPTWYATFLSGAPVPTHQDIHLHLPVSTAAVLSAWCNP